jgi:hypothetical protein
MRGRATLIIIAAATFVGTFVRPPFVTGKRPEPQSVQKPSEESQASPEAREKLRRLAAKKTTYQVGYSPAMERRLTQLSGIEIPRGTVNQALQVREKAKLALARFVERRERYFKEHPNEFFISESDGMTTSAPG